MTIYSFILIMGGIILFLAGVPFIGVIGILILVNLVVLIEDSLTGGRLFQKIIKEIKREPIVIHDVIIESDGKEDFRKWTKTESNNSSHSYPYGTKRIGPDNQW